MKGQESVRILPQTEERRTEDVGGQAYTSSKQRDREPALLANLFIRNKNVYNVGKGLVICRWGGKEIEGHEVSTTGT